MDRYEERVAFYFDSISLDPDTGDINYSVVNGSVSISRFTPLRYSTGASAVYLPDIDRVLFFGGHRKENKTLDSETLYLVEYDFQTSEWNNDMSIQLAPGVNQTAIPLPANEIDLQATLAPNDFDPYDSTAHKSFNDIAILDTQTWKWMPPSAIYGEPPKPRILADAGIVNDNYLIITHGVSHTGKLLSDINVVRLPDISDPTGTFTWVTNITEGDASNSIHDSSRTRPNGGKIAGITIACVISVAVLILTVYYYFSRRVRLAMRSIFRYFVWDLRVGEPHWTRASQLIFRIILLGIFSAYLGYNVKLVTNSPISTLTLISQVDQVTFPGFSRMTLQLESGALSTADLFEKGFIQEIIRPNNTLTIPEDLEFDGYNDMSTTCYLFTPSNPFPIVKSTANDSVRFTLAYVQVLTESENFIYVELYPHGRNPNLVTYNNTEQPYLSQQELEIWQQTDIDDSQIGNRYKIDPSSQNTIIYDLQLRRSLRNDSWNNIGFASVYEEVPELVTTFKPLALNESLQIAAIDIYPRSMTNTVLQEQRIYTLIGVIGQVAGLFALLVTIDRTLFGAQPQSPWGIVQRLSMGSLRRSLLNKLYGAFGDMKRPVPFECNNTKQKSEVAIDFDQEQGLNEKSLHNTDNRRLFSKSAHDHTYINTPSPSLSKSSLPITQESQQAETLESRVNSIESHLSHVAITHQQLADTTLSNHHELQRRIQLMEVLLKTYYIDDEIFLKLDHSHENNNSNNQLGDGDKSGASGSGGSKDTLLSSSNDSLSQTANTNNNEQNVAFGVSRFLRKFRKSNNYNSVEDQLSKEVPSPLVIDSTAVKQGDTNQE
ncbi:hypothetical protein BDA99DRAFT_609449 [Phascolomyces articulosus]|uniref:Uncharacterized protein n=1 Tax=Phascolomyces articulosus TaxID=60185 RepID=A0AAD5JYQ8_9FUNG|nr:hypothetical protein BDA99DRAFT_609449 [Phascolomyces articulosus]